MLAPGLRIGECEVVRRAAAGAMSEVYEARHAQNGRAVAVKVLHAAWCLHAELVARFLNEAHALEGFGHPRIVAIFARGELPTGQPFMVLEWLPIDLDHALLRAGGALAPRTAMDLAWQLADALGVLHARGVVHRDLKPANVLMAEEDLSVAQVKLGDLGLAKVLRRHDVDGGVMSAVPPTLLPISTGGGAVLGTWDYMAPEQWIKSKDVELRTDVYALGVLLFQMLTGRLPFVAEQEKDLMYYHLFEPPPLHLLDALGVPAVRELVARMLQKKTSLRPTMREVTERLTELR